MTPSYLPEKLPPNRRPLYTFNNSNTFHEIRCKTSRYKNSYFPEAMSSWNNIITNFLNVPTLTSLKTRIPSLIRPKIKSIFDVHDPLGLRYLFQLRVNLSPLRSHKRQHNFSDTSSEICEYNLGIEDIRHFLFECICDTTHRVTFAVNIINILQCNNFNHLGNQPELYLYGHPYLDLYGHPYLDFTDNRNVLLSTIKNI